MAVYNQPGFITDDPISVAHRFSKRQDIEIAGLFSAIMAWGQRKTIIANSMKLMELMDMSPHQFLLQHAERDLQRFLDFRHRTFQPDDVLFLISVLRSYYQENDSLETAFATGIKPGDPDVEKGLRSFYNMVFDRDDVMRRTQKHIPTPDRKSSCKRLNMYLRWMVRSDDQGVDFGLWKRISMAQLIMPLDVHVGTVARRLGLLHRRKHNDWVAAKELTENLRRFDAEDPVKYDFALFGVGVSARNVGKDANEL